MAKTETRRAAGASANKRSEEDLLGGMEIPTDALWGIHTSRAVENFPITGTMIGDFPELVRALVLVKQAAARANRQLDHLSPERAAAIEAACARILADRSYAKHFVVDAIQGGAGTSTNMNVNEVIANVGLNITGRHPGSYRHLHPNDDVNMAQSTNDAYPTALRLAMVLAAEPLLDAQENLVTAFRRKAVELADVLKVGRTQLQDAVPMTLGQEFEAYAAAISEDIARIRQIVPYFFDVNLGGTAIGTGITADPRYGGIAVKELARLSGYPIVQAPNLISATSDTSTFVLFSGLLKSVALKLSKIASDLRLLSSGPRAGLGEIRLPPVQAGSSIIPGKINPVIPEVVNQVAFLVAGYDVTVGMCAEAGQLQLNAFEPTIGYCMLSSMKQLTAAVTTLTNKCVVGIEADHERCRTSAENSIGLLTALGPSLGYEMASHIAKRALHENRRVDDIILEEQLLDADELAAMLGTAALTSPSRPKTRMRAMTHDRSSVAPASPAVMAPKPF